VGVSFVRRARAYLVVATALVLVFTLLYGWRTARSSDTGPLDRSPLSVSTLVAQPRAVAGELQAVGTLQAVSEVVLAPDVAGRVTAIHFESGQFVQAGDVLVNLYDAPEQADRAAAIAEAEFAQLQLRRAQQLAHTGAESRELLERRQAEADKAAALVQQLDARIEQKTIRAPFAGRIGIRRINLGQYLNAGDPIATLTQLDPLYVNFMLPQQELPHLVIGGPVHVTVDAVPEQLFTGSISAIEPRVDGATRNVAVQALLDNVGGKLQSGMYVTTRAVLPASEMMVVPLTAVQATAFGDHVMRVDELGPDGVGTVVSKRVTTGRRLGDEVVVLEGIEPGDRIVVAGQNRFPPGARVQVREAETVADTVAATGVQSR
jgi:multidrug efflux system membrane fusion protein